MTAITSAVTPASITTQTVKSVMSPVTLIPTVEVDVEMKVVATRLGATMTSAPATPVVAAPAVAARPFVETGIPPRQTSGTPVWMWPVTIVAIALIGAIAYWTTRPAPKVPAPVASPPAQSVPSPTPRSSNAVAQATQSMYQGTGRECTAQTTSNCVINNGTGRVIMILRNGDRVSYLCPDVKDGTKICSVIGNKREELPGGVLIDHRKVTFDNRVVVALSR